MKIYLDENYNIVQEEERNFGRGNHKYDYIEVYIPSISIGRDDTLPTFLFETPVQKQYGPFVHDTPTWFYDKYTVFKLTLNDAILSQNGELTITIAINFYNEENKIIKVRRVTAKGFVLDNIVINGEVVIIGNETTILESLNQKVDAYNKVIAGVNNNLNVLESKTLRFGRYLGEFSSIDEMYQSVLDLFNYEEDTSSVASATLDSYSYIFYNFYNIQGTSESFFVFDLKEKNFYVVTYDNNQFVVKKNFITEDEFQSYKSNSRSFYEVDNISKLNNIPIHVLDDYSGIFIKQGQGLDRILLKTHYAGIGGGVKYISFDLQKAQSTYFMIIIYEVILHDSTFQIKEQEIRIIPRIFINPDDEKENKGYIRTLRIDNSDYDLDYKAYTDGEIGLSKDEIKSYIHELDYLSKTSANEKYYDKTAIQNLLSNLSLLRFEVVEELPNLSHRPDTNVIYLVPSSETTPSNIYEEWIVIDGKWELLGNTKIDLSNYINIHGNNGTETSSFENSGRINANVTGDGFLSKFILAGRTIELSINVSGRECKLLFAEGQCFLVAPDDGSISLQAGTISISASNATLNGSSILTEKKLTTKLQSYVKRDENDGSIHLEVDDYQYDGDVLVETQTGAFFLNSKYIQLTRRTASSNLVLTLENDVLTGQAFGNGSGTRYEITNNKFYVCSYNGETVTEFEITPTGVYIDIGSTGVMKPLLCQNDLNLSDTEIEEIMMEVFNL
ncbi:MAG: hypothetical protein NC087_04380 [Anaeroplasma bactoclasticum]|nr:hypothetical protein [Anaeroplasma bactoclasticum]